MISHRVIPARRFIRCVGQYSRECGREGGHTPSSSLRWRFFLARSSAIRALARSLWFAFLPPLAICRQQVSWYNLLKRELVTHLRDTAQSNNVASNFVYTRCSDPPSNSRHQPKRQNLHPHWFQRHDQRRNVYSEVLVVHATYD